MPRVMARRSTHKKRADRCRKRSARTSFREANSAWSRECKSVASRVRRKKTAEASARELCAGLLTWAFARGATRAYVQVVTENAAARALYESMGFQVHHRSRYVRAEDLL